MRVNKVNKKFRKCRTLLKNDEPRPVRRHVFMQPLLDETDKLYYTELVEKKKAEVQHERTHHQLRQLILKIHRV